MTLSERDRRILMFLVPVVILVAYWFLILSPKRSDLSAARDAQQQAEQARDEAVALAAQLERARETFAADYAAVVRLGKAIPATVDAPSLLVQLDRASRGTEVDLDSVTFGERTAGTVTAPQATATETTPADPGGAPAQSAPGQTAEQAGATAQQAGGTGTTTTTEPPASDPNATTAAPSSATAAPLDTVAVTFNFTGGYFDLADFFHRLKRYVYVTNNRIFVRGRLMTIDTLTFAAAGDADAGGAPSGELTATVGATVYLSPKAEGATGGATATGPPGTTTEATPAGAQTSSLPLATAGTR